MRTQSAEPNLLLAARSVRLPVARTALLGAYEWVLHDVFGRGEVIDEQNRHPHQT